MDASRFDHLSKQLAAGSRRNLLGALAAMTGAAAMTATDAVGAKRQRGVRSETFNKRKATYCLNGETIRRYRRKQEKLLAMGATLGKCPATPPPPPLCADSCAGCCTGETCSAGNTLTVCGSNGDTCAACGDGQQCQGRCCTPSGGVCDINNPGECCSLTCVNGQPATCL
ncbi:MAG: hypothetical protein QM692_04895 [Thermomicrobiales bacterium]